MIGRVFTFLGAILLFVFGVFGGWGFCFFVFGGNAAEANHEWHMIPAENLSRADVDLKSGIVNEISEDVNSREVIIPNRKTARRDVCSSFLTVKIKPGDTIEAFSRLYVVPETYLLKCNNLERGKKGIVRIFAGDSLHIPLINWKAYEGMASWYGDYFHGRLMANGERYDMNNPSVVAHRHYPFGTRLRITNLNNGKSIIVTVSDRGPYHEENGRYAREVDLSMAAAKKIGAYEPGVVPVRIEPLPVVNQ